MFLTFNYLALDASHPICSVALVQGDHIAERINVVQRQHAQYILNLIQDLFVATNCALDTLDFIALGIGPGSFTGMRLATSVVQGLALGAQLPVVCVSSLKAIALAACERYVTTHCRDLEALSNKSKLGRATSPVEGADFRASLENKSACEPSIAFATPCRSLRGDYSTIPVQDVAVAIHAYGGKIYWGYYRLSAQGMIDELVPAHLCEIDQIKWPEDRAESCLGAGDAWMQHQAIMDPQNRVMMIDALAYAQAKYIGHLGLMDYRAHKTVPADQLSPIYSESPFSQ